MGKCWNCLNLVIFGWFLTPQKIFFWLCNLNRMTKVDEIFNLASTNNSQKVLEKTTLCNIILGVRNDKNRQHTLLDSGYTCNFWFVHMVPLKLKLYFHMCAHTCSRGEQEPGLGNTQIQSLGATKRLWIVIFNCNIHQLWYSCTSYSRHHLILKDRLYFTS